MQYPKCLIVLFVVYVTEYYIAQGEHDNNTHAYTQLHTTRTANSDITEDLLPQDSEEEL